MNKKSLESDLETDVSSEVLEKLNNQADSEEDHTHDCDNTNCNDILLHLSKEQVGIGFGNWPRVLLKDFQMLSEENQLKAKKLQSSSTSRNSQLRLKCILTMAFKIVKKKTMTVDEVYHWICSNFPSYRATNFPWKVAIKAILTSDKSFMKQRNILMKCWEFRLRKTLRKASNSGVKERSKAQFLFPPQLSSMLKIKRAMFRNVVSFNIDSFKTHNNKVILAKKYNPIKMETPISMLMHHDQPKYDIFVSSDEEEFVESDGKTKIVPVEDFVQSSWINPCPRCPNDNSSNIHENG